MKEKEITKIQGTCIDCGEIFPPESPTNRLRCKNCKRVYNNSLRKQTRYFKALGNIKICCDCGTNISGTGNKTVRCEVCQHMLEMKRKRKKRQELWNNTEHLCEICGTDISERNHNATICWACRTKHQKKANKHHYLGHKKEHGIAQEKYYKKNKKKVMKTALIYQKKKRQEKKKIFSLNLDNKQNKQVWVEWDSIPRCEGLSLDPKSYNNNFGTQCILRSNYKIKDKYDGTVRYLCVFHLKTIGSLKWYNIEKLERDVAIRRITKIKWKKMQRKELEKDELRKIERNKKERKRKVPMPYQNSHLPIVYDHVIEGKE